MCFARLPAPGEERGWLNDRYDQWQASGQRWDAYFRAWADGEGLHSGEDILSALQARFETRELSYGAYFFPDLSETSEAGELAAIDAGEIQANRIQYHGSRQNRERRPVDLGRARSSRGKPVLDGGEHALPVSLIGEPGIEGPVPGTPEFAQMLSDYESATQAMAADGALWTAARCSRRLRPPRCGSGTGGRWSPTARSRSSGADRRLLRAGVRRPGRGAAAGRDHPGGPLRGDRGAPLDGAAGPGVTSQAEVVFRREWGRAVAVVTRLTGDLGLAEDAVQEAFASAVHRWTGGLLPSASVWIGRPPAAKNHAMDRLRREAPAIRQGAGRDADAQPTRPRSPAGPDRRRPAPAHLCLLPPGAGPRHPRRAATLRTLCGLSTAEIAEVVPCQRGDPGAAAGAGQAEDTRRGHTVPHPGRRRSAGPDRRRAAGGVPWFSPRDIRPALVRGCPRRAVRRGGPAGAAAGRAVPGRPRGARTARAAAAHRRPALRPGRGPARAARGAGP